jgi:hypothetical protein
LLEDPMAFDDVLLFHPVFPARLGLRRAYPQPAIPPEENQMA